ncbi:MAG: FliM/FliN family flagellar motor switch protein [Eubacteriales bacterium]
MAEVLSQSQIDALLNAALTGEMEEEAKDEEPEKKYRKYDFNSPRKFTKDRLRILNSIFEGYTRIINSHMNALLHANCDLLVESVEEQRYYEFSNAITESDVLAVATTDRKEIQEESPIVIFIDTPVMLTMLDRLMGGTGEPDEDLSMDYMMTDLELQMYESLMIDFIKNMGQSWENYMDLNFEYVRTEENPTLVQLIGYDETVVIVNISVKFSNAEGRFVVCLPGNMLTNAFKEINQTLNGQRNTGEDKSEDIFGMLRDSSLEIVAELGRTQLTLADIYHLNVGDVIDIKKPKDSEVFLKISGRTWFDGYMGVYEKQVAVKIGETHLNE